MGVAYTPCCTSAAMARVTASLTRKLPCVTSADDLSPWHLPVDAPPLPLYARCMPLGRPDASHFHLDRNVKRQSGKASLAGSVTGIARQSLVGIPPARPARLSKCCGRATLPSARPLNGTGVSHKTPLFRSWIYLNETNGTHSRYKNASSATTSVSSRPFPDTVLPMAWYTVVPKWDTKFLPIDHLSSPCVA